VPPPPGATEAVSADVSEALGADVSAALGATTGACTARGLAEAEASGGRGHHGSSYGGAFLE